MSDNRISLSVLVPVYNEQHVAAASLARLTILEQCEFLSSIEVIVVDDGSSDRTPQVLAEFAREKAAAASNGGASKFRWRFQRHPKNLGKGAALRTALGFATGDVSVVHDADLEYHPRDLIHLLRVFVEQQADAVYGSRFAGAPVRRVLLYRHQIGNRILTLLCNLISNLNLTDVWTCYKAVRTPLLKSIPLVSDDFGIEPEITIKLAKREALIFEVPISYFGRTYDEGKKIGWRDGLRALRAMLRFAISDAIYCEDEYGSHILARLSRAPRFNAWLADTIKPYCGERVLEIGSGVGNIAKQLMPRVHYVASDINPLYLQTLSNLGADRPYMKVAFCDVTDVKSFPENERFDTVVSLNVIEHVDDDRAALNNIKSRLVPGGRAIVLVPQGPGNFGTLDEVLGHRRRYTRESLARLAADCGFEVREILQFNRIGSLAWYLNGKLLRRRSFGLGQVWSLNVLTPLMRRLDTILPLPPLSLIGVLELVQLEDADQSPATSTSKDQAEPASLR
ncbi:MAG TPA: bifunctional glycosyltransferase/class I SAM-dependent methyltransferase [Candidatus Binataceae bacterium]|nr:bifunctional glycosyltransferase/class I SAM-dependent methyltransferase [Candidatus Binataceae bacterium]